MSTIKLNKKINYTGTIVLKTGLHIGGTNAALNIGGPDNFVVRNPLTNVPYIPGSSLKGKMRALIEISTGDVSSKGEASENPNGVAGKLFGVGANKGGHPSRLIVRDAELIIDDPEVDFSRTDLLYAESKTEVTINRVTAEANPRTFERVPAGAKFNLNMVLNIFEGENEDELKRTLEKAMQLLENDYLGGQGSRGYGQVKFENIEITESKY
ncbi:MAG TPA: type III-A CRISPR-associated RAMP protein Csm3 [Paludibacteraceae bacterium]|nr:type III-A CRISPR-associated RAMP protein Csm3 [Paludibacteraceae bacterium]OPZ03378.1 MAG: RAMP superfamily protein [Bacteroidetes bacterium ADurb.BinA395]MBP8967011.1 type III-A CRISPR-associated RAMP protein Csm3 [Paludibacteraceae bacterium]HOF99278.1 type III-A CRISPR-associated RAMP protein Csm3 [Paludibacteraceae bacterium]HOJ66769.1 type III-A CRISPR-associated RAMP protein Csm3 [Paludibacteraceae bacterium]